MNPISQQSTSCNTSRKSNHYFSYLKQADIRMENIQVSSTLTLKPLFIVLGSYYQNMNAKTFPEKREKERKVDVPRR